MIGLGDHQPFIFAKVFLNAVTLPNKRQRQSLGKRHTNTRTLGTRAQTSNQSRSAIATGQNPSIQVSKAGVEPPPIPVSSDKWVMRTLQQEVSVPVLTTAGQQVSVTPPTQFYGAFLDKVQIWGIGTQSLYTSLLQTACTDLGNDEVIASDFSSLAQCPGITYKIPVGHATEIAASTPVLKIDRLGDISFKAIVHWHGWIRY